MSHVSSRENALKPQTDEEREIARQKRYRYMTETPVGTLIRELSVPTIISMMVSALYNMADTFFVGKISTQATAAVGIVFSVQTLIQSFGFFCGHGSGNYMSRMLGAGNRKEAREMGATGFALSIIIGVIFAAIGLSLLHPIALLLGATPTTVTDTENYMRLILIGAPIMMSQFVINNQLRFQGSAAYAMVGLVSGSVLNILLDPILIFGLHLGVSGAALATILSQCVSFTILWIGNHRGANLGIDLRLIRLNRHYLLEIVNGGMPSLMRQGFMSVSTILLNTKAGFYGGDAAIAGMAVVSRVMMICISALIGFGQGYQPVCAFNYGAHLYKRVKDGFWFCVKYGTIFLIGVGLLCGIFAPQVIGFFRDDPDVIRVGSVALRCQAVIMFLNAYTIISNMMMQSIGRGVRATLLSASRSGLFFIPLILILPQAFGLLGVEITQTIADLLSFGLTIPIIYSELRRMQRAEDGLETVTEVK